MTIVVSDAEGIVVERIIAGPQEFPPEGGPAIVLRRGDSVAGVDAETGRVFVEQIKEADQPAFSQILGTVQAGCPRPTDAPPWPYGPLQPAKAKARQGKLLYWEPEPDAGLVVHFQVGESTAGGYEALVIENVRSRRFVNINSGKVVATNDRIAPEDAAAIERWTQAVEVVAP